MTDKEEEPEDGKYKFRKDECDHENLGKDGKYHGYTCTGCGCRFTAQKIKK